MKGVAKGLIQAYQVQDFAFACIESFKAGLLVDGQLKVTRDDATSLGHLVKSWQTAQERISFHRRVPSPGSLRPEKKIKVKRDALTASWEEPKQVQDAVVVQPSGVTLPKDGAVAPIAGETSTPQVYKSQ